MSKNFAPGEALVADYTRSIAKMLDMDPANINDDTLETIEREVEYDIRPPYRFFEASNVHALTVREALRRAGREAFASHVPKGFLRKLIKF
jgi:hypothetical protein